VPVANTLAEIRRYLENEIAEGRATAEVSPETAAAFKRAASSGPARRSPETPAAAPAAERARAEEPAAAPAAGDELAAVARAVAGCARCGLHKSRANTVPGEGPPRPAIMFVGEGPGEEEDRQGRPFVGAAGQLLTRMIEAMGFAREEVFIGNVVKCRPPGNRTPLPEEMEACLPYLRRQIAALQPRVIVALGGTASKALLGLETGITRLRGVWHSFEGIDLMPTYHPAYLLRNASGKRPAWEDLQEVLRRLGRPVPGPKKRNRQG